MAGKTDDVLAQVLASPTPAAAARAMGRNEKGTRDVLRSRFGVFVGTTPEAWNDTLKRALHAYLSTTDVAERKAIVAAYKDAPAPQ